jgi:hypothetical protein
MSASIQRMHGDALHILLTDNITGITYMIHAGSDPAHGYTMLFHLLMDIHRDSQTVRM